MSDPDARSAFASSETLRWDGSLDGTGECRIFPLPGGVFIAADESGWIDGEFATPELAQRALDDRGWYG